MVPTLTPGDQEQQAQTGPVGGDCLQTLCQVTATDECRTLEICNDEIPARIPLRTVRTSIECNINIALVLGPCIHSLRSGKSLPLSATVAPPICRAVCEPLPG